MNSFTTTPVESKIYSVEDLEFDDRERGQCAELSALDRLDAMELTVKQAEELCDSNWIVPNLIIEGHIIAICAPPNGGKTTILYHLSGEMAASGYSVRFIHADVGPGEAKGMLENARDKGFKYITPDLSPEGNVATVLSILRELVDDGTRLDGAVFQIDTLKKVADLMSKGSVKALLNLCRQLTGLGATVILLCHTNKHKDADGNHVFEGVGDIRNDVDELIYLVPKHNDDGTVTVSTNPDKKRGIFTPMTYDISATRNVTQSATYVDTGAIVAEDAKFDKDEELIGLIKMSLEAKRIRQTEICDWVRDWQSDNDKPRTSEKRIANLLWTYKHGRLRQWHYRPGMQKNAKEYSLEAFL